MKITWWGKEDPNTLRLLFWFRTFSILGQIATSLLAKMVFAFPLNGWGIATVISSLVLVNTYTWIRSIKVSEPGYLEIFIQLLIDVIALTFLFYFSGGATNPFVSMYLLPVAISAVLLPQMWVWILAAVSMSAYSYLMWLYPNQHAHHNDQSFMLHVFGMWVSFVLSACVIAFFVVKMRAALQQKNQLLRFARERAIKDEKLVSLGALAASTAHEMGTPLGTIQIIIADLEENNISQEEIDILLEQVIRCKQALAEMSKSAGGLNIEEHKISDFEEFLISLLDDWHQTRPAVKLNTNITSGDKAGVIAGKTLSKALINLLDNAADASPEVIYVDAKWQHNEARLKIIDQGEGIDPKVLAEIGTKPYSTKPDGIGLGAFLAHEIIQRLGGAIKLTNRPSGGVETIITLPIQPLK
ncbi:MAG: ATP-binding protein [Gammaproteobacteria bacterium]|nr:ATP-binding protein [Gammaproteobacteria bacterium]